VERSNSTRERIHQDDKIVAAVPLRG